MLFKFLSITTIFYEIKLQIFYKLFPLGMKLYISAGCTHLHAKTTLQNYFLSFNSSAAVMRDIKLITRRDLSFKIESEKRAFKLKNLSRVWLTHSRREGGRDCVFKWRNLMPFFFEARYKLLRRNAKPIFESAREFFTYLAILLKSEQKCLVILFAYRNLNFKLLIFTSKCVANERGWRTL